MSMPPINDHPYYRVTPFNAMLRGRPLQIVSKPGFPNWDRISPAVHLLAESITPDPAAQILHLGCGHGALGVALAQSIPQGQITLLDANYTATTMAQQTLATNKITNATVIADPAPLPTASFDIVVLEAPSGRKFARRWLAIAHAALRPGGQLYLAGPKAEGIEALISDARALFQQTTTLAYRDHNRIAVATKGPTSQLPTWATEPGIAPGTFTEFSTAIAGQRLTISSLPGVFSFDHLDAGTALLLQHLKVQSTERVLDIGCGWGAIGLAAAVMGATQVDLVDSNLLAVAATQRTIANTGYTNLRALPSDALSAVADQRYDLIVTNPPFHAGKPINYDAATAFIAGAQTLLTSGGRLLLVANAFIRYERVMRAMFPHVEVVAEDRRYHLIQGISRSQ